jgi:hypothetical protein
VGGAHQRRVVVPAKPGPAFVVVQAELAFELLVVELHLPAHACESREPLGLGVGWEVRDPVVGRLVLAVGPFGDQPFLAWGDLRPLAPLALVLAPTVRGVHPCDDEL